MSTISPPASPLHRTLSRSHTYESLTVEGDLPNDIAGTLYRAGPGVFERFGIPLKHPFEADGAVTGVRFGSGLAVGGSRIVESPGYLEEERAGKPLYGSPASWLRRVGNAVRGKSKTTGNTSMLQWQGRLFALMEGALPQEIAPADLSTLQPTDLQGLIGQTFSAHPHRVSRRRTTINFGLRYERAMHVDLFELPDFGPPRQIGSFEAPWMGMLHDFIVTENYAVFVIGPAKLALWRAIVGSTDFSKLFQWKPELGCQVVVVPLDDPSKLKRIELDPFWVWHFGNAYEKAPGRIELDMCRYDDFGSLDAIASPEIDLSPPLLHRMSIDVASGDVQIEQLWDQLCEFPRVHPDLQGRRHSTLWMQTEIDGKPGISRFSLSTGKASTWEAPEGHLISEPVPVPKAPGSGSGTFALEEKVWVMSLVLDTENDCSYVAVLDGERPTAGPVAQVWFDQPLPLTFHGTWVPGRVLR